MKNWKIIKFLKQLKKDLHEMTQHFIVIFVAAGLFIFIFYNFVVLIIWGQIT
jgi:hypothetical protein